MTPVILESKEELGRRAAEHGAERIREAIERQGEASNIVATGASQFEMLEHLVRAEGIHWPAVTGFHLDEYVGMPITHPASFRRYLWERFASRLGLPMKAFHYVNGERDPAGECRRLGTIIQEHAIDVAFIGIGENGHLAFNDPPADFETNDPYIVVDLDDACRRQQLGEGWFPNLEDVPRQAISMSIRQIMASETIVVSVPDRRKAAAVKACMENEVDPRHPATCLRLHDDVHLYLDAESASLLSETSST